MGAIIVTDYITIDIIINRNIKYEIYKNVKNIFKSKQILKSKYKHNTYYNDYFYDFLS